MIIISYSNVEKAETYASYKTKYNRQQLKLLHNGRILSVNNGFYSIFGLESNISSDIFQTGDIEESIILTK